MKHARRSLYFLLVIFFICLSYFGYFLHDHVRFERFLNTQYITFKDFSPDYSEAVIDHFSHDPSTRFEYDYSSYPLYDPAYRIPPTIHFIWFKDLYEVRPTGTNISHEGSDAPNYCKYYNQEEAFKTIIWDAPSARQLIEENYSWFLPTYDGYKHPIQRVDAFKYFVLWHYGGVYIDMDISCRRSLIPLLQFPAWFPRASPLGINNDLMAARPRHPVIGKMTEMLRTRDRDLLSPWLTIFWTTGPRFATDILKMWYDENASSRYFTDPDVRLGDPDSFYILPSMFYSEKYSFFGHRAGGSWYGSDVAVVLWILARPWLVQSLAVIAALCCLILMARGGMWKKTLAFRRRWSNSQKMNKTSSVRLLGPDDQRSRRPSLEWEK